MYHKWSIHPIDKNLLLIEYTLISNPFIYIQVVSRHFIHVVDTVYILYTGKYHPPPPIPFALIVRGRI